MKRFWIVFIGLHVYSLLLFWLTGWPLERSPTFAYWLVSTTVFAAAVAIAFAESER